MAKNCPECGLVLEEEVKFCPGCGASVTENAEQSHNRSDDAITIEPDPPTGEKRVFVPREKKYGDTEHFEEPPATDNERGEPSAWTGRLSLYLSIIACVLSVTAIVLVILFAVIPSSQQKTAADARPTVATEAPTQPPTDPPITGTYSLYDIRGEKVGMTALMLRGSQLEMRSDYTGTLSVGAASVGSVTLDRESDSAVMLNTDCTYTFDGRVLVIDYNGMTFVFKKQ